MTAVLTHSPTMDPPVAPAGPTPARGAPAMRPPVARHRPGTLAAVAVGAGGRLGERPASSLFELVTALAVLESRDATRTATAAAHATLK